jgi:signal transduction histidine kinase
MLRVEVRDDGTGIAAGAVGGVGLRSLRERAAELGGTVEIADAPGGGTVVGAALPLAHEPQTPDEPLLSTRSTEEATADA